MREARKMGDVVVIDAGRWPVVAARQFGEFLISEPPILRNPTLGKSQATLHPALEVATEKLPLALHLPFHHC